jgi:hypothetical protein
VSYKFPKVKFTDLNKLIISNGKKKINPKVELIDSQPSQIESGPVAINPTSFHVVNIGEV